MSEAANLQREKAQHWAEPGSRHDKLVGTLKIALPSAVGVVAAIFLMLPLTEDQEVSFILDKKDVGRAEERMKIEAARYSGTDDKGQPFVLNADRAVQQTSNVPIVDISGVRARLGLAQGPATIQALQGRYNLDQQQVAVSGPVRVSGPEGEQLLTRDVLIDLKSRQVRSTGQIGGRMPVGTFNANSLSADLGTRQVALNGAVTGRLALGTFSAARMRADLNSRVVVLDGGARLKITPGTVR
ncbi:LPS export ABC transporter periplasmic protein LptC [Sphingomonas glaciei]|uniref:LPS export ABC transporter periplasmic protein LptC n=1 Tax=Sphingomonas glaciei TaxID=2938948 RepID=A0ABY5MTV9_9SPHN|nr:LPS export ABC transporter periplasmic protein LptC [Sphingomonas glaciei]UUR07211.1 LPS export ABC transporter periplasmic protein LptC [Sphingomonas glaciei]